MELDNSLIFSLRVDSQLVQLLQSRWRQIFLPILFSPPIKHAILIKKLYSTIPPQVLVSQQRVGVITISKVGVAINMGAQILQEHTMVASLEIQEVSKLPVRVAHLEVTAVETSSHRVDRLLVVGDAVDVHIAGPSGSSGHCGDGRVVDAAVREASGWAARHFGGVVLMRKIRCENKVKVRRRRDVCRRLVERVLVKEMMEK